MVITILNGLNSEIRTNPGRGSGRGRDFGGNGPTLFVSGLPFRLQVSEDDVREFLQEKIPNAQNIRVPLNRVSKSIKGIAFVELGSDADVTSVISQVSNLQMGGRSLKINESKPRERARSPERASSRERARSPVGFGGLGGDNVDGGFGNRNFRGGWGGENFRRGFEGRGRYDDRGQQLWLGRYLVQGRTRSPGLDTDDE